MIPIPRAKIFLSVDENTNDIRIFNINSLEASISDFGFKPCEPRNDRMRYVFNDQFYMTTANVLYVMVKYNITLDDYKRVVEELKILL